MNFKFTVSLLLIASIAIFSCSKDNETNPEENQPETLITKMTQGVIPGDDTIFVFNYDEAKRLKSIINTSWLDTFEATYNTAGLITSIANKGDFGSANTSFSYNASNQLTQIDYLAGGYKVRYTFEYTGGVISKKTYYNVNTPGGTQLSPFRYTTYEVTNGNITTMKEYSYDDVFLSEQKLTYNNEPNVFQPMVLFNFQNRLGADDIADIEKFFNKNLTTGLTSTFIPTSETVSGTYTYTFNDKKQLTKAVASSPDYTGTRLFAY